VLAQGARTVVVVHLYGIPLDLRAVQHRVDRYQAVLIEDAAQGAGAARDGRPLGSIGAFGVLSFGRGKGITGGRGGALLANDEHAATALATVGDEFRPARTSASEPIAVLAQWLLARPSLYGIPASLPLLGLGETIYRRPEEPRAMSPFALGVLSHTLADADREADLRRSHASRLLARAAADSGLVRTVRTPVSAVAGYLRLPLLLPDEWRARYGSPAAKRLGIMPGYPTTLAELAGFSPRVRNAGVAFPGARRLVASLVTLPTHGRVSERDLRALERWIAGRD
jgi:perosamine synthetase